MNKILFLLLTLCSFSIVHGDFTWTSPNVISTALVNATNPQVVIDDNNNITAIWLENTLLQASTSPSGGSWSAPVTISNPANTASSPKIGIDSSGNVTALWTENALIVSALKPFGSAWGSITNVSGTGATQSAMAIDASGNVVAVWTRSGFIESSTRKTGTWSLVAVLSATASNNPDVNISSFGTAMAVWHTVSAGSDLIVTDILTISSNTWAATKNVFTANAAFSHNYPKVALDASGNAGVAWFRYNFQNSAYQNVQLLTSSLSVGGATWVIPIAFSNISIRNPADLAIDLQFDTSGNALLSWTNSADGETFIVEVSRKLFGGAWPGAVEPQGTTLYSFSYDIAVASGTALFTTMAWNDAGPNIEIQAQQSDMTSPILQAWTPITTISSGGDNAYPKCAASISGSTLNAVTVWVHYDGTNTVIQASNGTDTIIIPPSGVSATQNVTDFGVYQDYYNTIAWTASAEPNLIQYNIYRNGIFFGATDINTLTFVDNNAVQGGTVTYGVSALKSDFRQSAIVNFTLN